LKDSTPIEMTVHPRPQIVHADLVAPQPWKNGGGQTRELLVWPSPTDWSLRVSVADIEQDGPFSPFPEVERWFAVIEGAGVVLRFADGERRLVPGDAPLVFAGAAAPDCRLIDGPTRDLNLMVRGGRGRMERVEPGVAWTPDGDWCGLFAAVAGAWRCADGAESQVPARTLVWFHAPPPGALTFTPEARSGTSPIGWWLVIWT
jgi:environmental stress-induced protein Ves